MLIQHQQNGPKGFFYIGKIDDHQAKMNYKIIDNNIMLIIHTEVGEELRGKNAGYQLVHTAVEYARANGLKIIPECSFAAAVFEKKKEYADVLAE